MEEAWKNQGFNGIRTRDLRNTGAMLYQLSLNFFYASSVQLLNLDKLLRWSFFTLIYNRSSNILVSYFIYTSHHFTPYGRYELNKLALLPMCDFIAQLVEYRTGIAEVTGSNPVEALIFQASSFQLHKLDNLLRWSFYVMAVLALA